MRNSFLFGAMGAVMLLGAGCVASGTVETDVTAEPLTQDEAAAQPEVRRISNELFTVGVPGSYEVTQGTGQARIQSYSSAVESKRLNPGEFYIEFFYQDVTETKTSLAEYHSRTEDVVIDEQHFTKGYDRAHAGGESSTGVTYLSAALSPKLLIRVSADDAEGLAKAEETVAKLQWK